MHFICMQECMSVGPDACDEFLAYAVELKTMLDSACSNFVYVPESYCLNGSTSLVVEKTPLCPMPLVYPNEDSYEGNTLHGRHSQQPSPHKISMIFFNPQAN